MSMAPVAAAMSGNSSGATKSKTQSIAWPGPAMKPSSDIDLFTTTLPFPVPVFGTVLLRRTFAGCHPGLRVMTLHAPGSHRLARDNATADDGWRESSSVRTDAAGRSERFAVHLMIRRRPWSAAGPADRRGCDVR